MLSADGCAGRIRRLQAWCAETGADLAVVSQEKEICYFTGFLRQPYGWLQPRLVQLAVFARGPAVLLASATERALAERGVPGVILVAYKDYDIHSSTEVYLEEALVPFREALAARGAGMRRIAIEKRYCPVAVQECLRALFPSADFVELSEAVRGFRRLKDPDEIETLRRTAELAGRCFEAAAAAVRPGRTEMDVYADCGAAYARALGAYVTFSGDFVSGQNAVKVGGPPSDKRLEPGEIMILDLWLDPFGYWSDSARTYAVGGKARRELRELYDLSIEAQAAGERALRPGAPAVEAYQAMRRSFDSHGMAGHFTTHGGHGVGLSPHEAPLLIPASSERLEAGMVVTLEPGLYVTGLGGARCEDNYLITSAGCERITRYERRIGWS